MPLFQCALLLALSAATPLPIDPAVLSTGWSVNRFGMNQAGAVVFAGGGFSRWSDGIVFSSPSLFVKFAQAGEEAPGVPGSTYAAFPDIDYGDLAMNDRNDVVFTASLANPDVEALFRYSNLKTEKLLLGGDPVPGRPGFFFRHFDRVWPNNSGDFAFMATVSSGPPGTSTTPVPALFVYRGGQVETVALGGEPAPGGGPFAIEFAAPTASFTDEGVLVFDTRLSGAIFRYANGRVERLLGAGETAPGGGKFQQILASGANRRGEFVIHASFGPEPAATGLFVLHDDGHLVRLIADGNSTPAGGSFSLSYEVWNRFGTKSYARMPLNPVISDSGSVLFAAPIKGGQSDGALFLFDGRRIQKVVASGEPRPDNPALQIAFAGFVNGGQPVLNIEYSLNNEDIVAFNPSSAGVFMASRGKLMALAGNLAPVDGTSYTLQAHGPIALADSGIVAFHSSLCCGTYTEGIFWVRPQVPTVPNASFENAGDGGLPAGWTTWWRNSGDTEAGRQEGPAWDAFEGSAVLRLGVHAGGGAVFVLSDPAPVSPDSAYLLECRMRFDFNADTDAAFLSVIQYDSAANEVGFDEVRAVPGESHWTWAPKRLFFRTAADAATVRYRVGLTSEHEKYLDLDAFR